MTCSKVLRDMGMPYPKTCDVCGLGPCCSLSPHLNETPADHSERIKILFQVTAKPDPASPPDPSCPRQFGCMSHQFCGKTGVRAAKPPNPGPLMVTPHDLFFAAALGAMIGNKTYSDRADVESQFRDDGRTGSHLLLGYAKEWADEAMKSRNSK